MELLTKLNKTTTKTSRRVGRGIGSCKGGHTSGRGQKGDKARGATALTFAGTKHKKSWIKRLPFLRGKHRLENQKNIINFNLSQIDKWFKADEVVDANAIIKKAKLSSKNLKAAFKILADGTLTKSLTFKGLPLSKSAQTKITASGGKIE